MPTRRKSVDISQMGAVTLFLMIGILLAVSALALHVDFVVWFKAFVITMIPIGIIYSALIGAKRASGINIVFLVFVGFIVAIFFQMQPQNLPFQVVPMDILGIPPPGVTATSIAVPDAVWMLGVATIVGLLLAIVNRQKSPPVVVLSIAMAFYASSAILSSVFFGKWGEWMILITPFTGLLYIGLVFAFGYIALAYFIWEQSKIAFWIYMVVQVLAIGYAILLQEWLSIIFSILIIAYLYMARGKFTHKATIPELPNL